MKRVSIWLACLLLVVGQQQVLRADDFNPDLPVEPQSKYVLTVSADPAGAAAALSGAGKYTHDTEVTISQYANEGYEFDHWSLNGELYSYDASCTYTVGTMSAAFVAHYNTLTPPVEENPDPVGVIVSVDNPEGGEVSGSGSYLPGTSVLISVTPNTAFGYSLSHWTKNGEYFGTMSSFYYTVEASPVEFKAYLIYTEFEPATPSEPSAKHPVYVSADPAIGATVYGDGVYASGEELTIAVYPKAGYRFRHWTLNGEVTDQPEVFTYTVGDEPAYFVAMLDYLQSVSVSANPADAGWTEGSGYYESGAQVSIYADAYSPYEFDYYTINGYRLDSAQRFTYTVGDSSVFIVANFRDTLHQEFDPVTPAEPIVYVRITATPPENYYFVSWNDGNTDNPRMVPANQVDDYEPIFAPVDFAITDEATICSNEYYMLGDNRLTVSGVYVATLQSSLGSDSVVTLHLTVNPSYFFSTVDTIAEEGEVLFMDTVLTTPGIYQRRFVSSLGCDSIYQHQIVVKKEIYTITVEPFDPVMGSVTGGGEYEQGKTVRIGAYPNEGYEFLQWSDGNTDNPRTIIVSEPATYIAQFIEVPGTGVADPAERADDAPTLLLIDHSLFIRVGGRQYTIGGAVCR